MKKILLTCTAMLVSLLFPSNAKANQQEETVPVHYLVVTLDDNSESRFALTESPVLTFEGQTLVITASGSQVSFDLEGVKEYRFATEDVPTGINRPSTTTNGEEKPVITLTQAKFNGLAEGTPIAVYSIDGLLISTHRAAANGEVVIDLANLPTGIYILKAPTKSYKIKH